MTNDLHERLREVAERAPAGAPAADLWRRGRSRQLRRAVASAAAITVVALATGIGGVSLWTRVGASRVGEPVGRAEPELALPDRFFVPSPWLQGTDQLGPGGPYVALLGAERRQWNGWWPQTSGGIVGVGADGSYRFLDLPDAARLGSALADVRPALSADGRHLAYWLAGLSEGEPLLESEGDEPVAGMAVLDTVTGEVTRRPVPSEHGLSPEGVAWAGDVVRFQFGAFGEGGVGLDHWSSETQDQQTWDARSGSWAISALTGRWPDIRGQSGQGAASYVASGRPGFLVVGPDGVERRFRLDQATLSAPIPSPSGHRVAAVRAAPDNKQDDRPHAVLVGELRGAEVTDQPRLMLDAVPGATTTEILGWRDEGHLVVRSADRSTAPHLVSLDVATGESQPLTELPDQAFAMPPQVASGAWGAPVVVAREPDWPPSSRARAGMVAAAVGGAWLVVLVWRRRRGRA